MVIVHPLQRCMALNVSSTRLRWWLQVPLFRPSKFGILILAARRGSSWRAVRLNEASTNLKLITSHLPLLDQINSKLNDFPLNIDRGKKKQGQRVSLGQVRPSKWRTPRNPHGSAKPNSCRSRESPSGEPLGPLSSAGYGTHGFPEPRSNHVTTHKWVKMKQGDRRFLVLGFRYTKFHVGCLFLAHSHIRDPYIIHLNIALYMAGSLYLGGKSQVLNGCKMYLLRSPAHLAQRTQQQLAMEVPKLAKVQLPRSYSPRPISPMGLSRKVDR